MVEIDDYQEENRQALIDLNKSVKGLNLLIKEQNDKYTAPKDEVKVSGDVTVNTEPTVDVDNLDEITDCLEDLGNTISNAIKDNSYKPQKEVTVKNIKEALPKDVKVNNLTDIAKYFTTLGNLIKDNKPIVNVAKQDIVFPTSPTNPIAVRLSDGKSFINQLVQAVSSGSVKEESNDITYTWSGDLLVKKVAIFKHRTETTNYTWSSDKLIRKVIV